MLAVSAVGALAAGGCTGASSNAASFAEGSAGGAGAPAANTSTASSSGAASNGAGGAASLPPEVKEESSFQSPVATGKIVWIANPSSGRVAYIDATTFAVKTVEAGNGPTYLAAIPDPNDDVALVLNVLSGDATLLRVQQGNLVTATFPSTADANALAISQSGRWAIAWTNTAQITNPDPTQGFEQAVVLDLSSATDAGVGARPPTSVTLGFRPVQVAFDEPNESHAFAVSEDGIVVIDLLDGAQPTPTANYPLQAVADADAGAADALSADDSGDAANAGDSSSADGNSTSTTGTASGAPDVSFTPDGSYALVRQDGIQSITVVALADGTTTTVPLPALPTDLTLSPAGDFAVAVLRDTSTVVVLPIPGIVSDPSSVTTTAIAGETIGRAIVTAQGKTALLFTTAAPVERMTVLTFAPTPTYRTIALHAPVLAVFPTADAQNAIVLHDITPSNGVEGAFSIVPIASSLPANIVSLPAPPTAVALAPSSDRALVSMRDDTAQNYGVYLARMPSLQTISYVLASPPIAVGIVAGADTGYIAQDYSEGRITFVDLEEDGGAGGVRTITGFELGARIVEGSSP
jgi:hypothetical protein